MPGRDLLGGAVHEAGRVKPNCSGDPRNLEKPEMEYLLRKAVGRKQNHPLEATMVATGNAQQ